MKCKNCNTDTDNPKFCSPRCSVTYNNSLRPKMKHQCLKCGADIVGYYLRNSKFCNKECELTFKKVESAEKVKLGLLSSNSAKKYMHENYSNCFICNLENVWNGKPLTLQVDHIDGNSDNNKLSNLRLICPNCHTQTETFCQRNFKNTKRNSYLRRYKKKVLYMN